MPTNVTAEYAKAEREYQQASTAIEKLKTLEIMLREVPKHKGTEALRAEIKTKISKIKEKLIKEKESKKKGYSLAVKKEGAAQIIFVGPPNTGKTSLLNSLTGAKYEVAEYPFTTTKPNLGTLDYHSVRLQLVDLPPMMEDAALKQASYFAIVRNSDLVLLIVDNLEQVPILLKEFSESHIILNKPKPSIKIKRMPTGGLEFIGEKFIKSNLDSVKKFLRDHNIANAVIEVFDKVRLDDFFEIIDERLAYLPALVVLNKQKEEKVIKKGKFEVVFLDGLNKTKLDLLKDKLWEKLGIIKIYTKEPGKKPSLKDPITLDKNSTIKEMAGFVHKDFIKKFNYAKIWGKSAKHNGQVVGMEHQLKDDDVVEIHLK